MTIAVWPSELPRPERNTWNARPQDARQKRQSDAGPPSWRLKFSNAAKMVSLSLLLTRDQNAVFDNFYQYETKKGSLLFWMPDPTTDGWALLTDDGSPLLISGGAQDGLPILLSAQWLCSFGDELPNETVQGIHFRRTFGVVVIP
ncbi:hypothetical protein [Neorhizobium petrolearium]|uniref:hypothetical protein n=1 Tax=Neorhizobium petrolearium TaxID=515361 RepID=UPI003F7DCC2E